MLKPANTIEKNRNNVFNKTHWRLPKILPLRTFFIDLLVTFFYFSYGTQTCDSSKLHSLSVKQQQLTLHKRETSLRFWSNGLCSITFTTASSRVGLKNRSRTLKARTALLSVTRILRNSEPQRRTQKRGLEVVISTCRRWCQPQTCTSCLWCYFVCRTLIAGIRILITFFAADSQWHYPFFDTYVELHFFVIVKSA